MSNHDPEFIPFLRRAKASTYAASEGAPQLFAPSSRPESHDLAYCEGGWAYHDTYLGGEAFIGEEAVWKDGHPLWGMNYYGTMTVEHIPEGFSSFLKLALRQPPEEAPFRGPAHLEQGRFTYTCRWDGTLAEFWGSEVITLDGQKIYHLRFHGGQVR